MPIKPKLQALIHFYASSRRAGHTTAALNGVRDTPRAVLICANYRQRNSLRCQKGQTAAVASLDDLEALRGRSFPIVLDNLAVIALAQDSLREIERLEEEHVAAWGRIGCLRAENDVLRKRSGQHLKQVEILKMRLGHAEARYSRALGELAWLRLPWWKKAVKYLRYPDLRQWRREAGE